MRSALIMAVAIVSGGGASYAGIGVEVYGTSAPPSRVAGVPVFPPLVRTDVFEDTLFAPIDFLGQTARFSAPVSVRRIGSGWATWSHGYTGNAYYTNGLTELTIDLSGAVVYAFQCYVEPNPFGVFQTTATGSDGSSTVSATQDPDGSFGATGWGFYGTGGAFVRSVVIRSDVDFAVGEFAATDTPSPAGLAAFALMGLRARRRRR